MLLNYIDENIEKIINNPESILYFRAYYVLKERALFAVIKEDVGIYKKIQITKEQPIMTYTREPLLLFDSFLLKDFIILNSNNIALNKK